MIGIITPARPVLPPLVFVLDWGVKFLLVPALSFDESGAIEDLFRLAGTRLVPQKPQ